MRKLLQSAKLVTIVAAVTLVGAAWLFLGRDQGAIHRKPVFSFISRFLPYKTKAHPLPVRDGQLVLLRKGTNLGGFFLRGQRGDTVSYDWFSLGEGRGSYYIQQSGTVTNASEVNGQAFIHFSGFSVPWSKRSQGEGWLYYGRNACGSEEEWDIEMAVTDYSDSPTKNADPVFQRTAPRLPDLRSRL
jgi:hypothetical protein